MASRRLLSYKLIARAVIFKRMKFIVHFFVKKLDPETRARAKACAHSADFPDLKVAIEATKEEADAIGADVFELDSDNGSIRQRWERNDGQWKRSSSTPRS
jgi:hypothetical protein